jgi:hypothetical protein
VGVKADEDATASSENQIALIAMQNAFARFIENFLLSNFSQDK